MAYSGSYNSFFEGLSSFQLVRTNPKLTGNVKITVDSSGGLWLDSIDANDQLSKNDYKKFPLSVNDKHGINLRNFFNGGKTPTNIIYEVRREVNDNNTSSDYANQFDFSGYTSGAKYLKSRYYSERFSYFAPIYLKDDIPNYFVIFRIPGPLNNPQVSESNDVVDNKSYFTNMLREMEVVKTFDLSQESVLGKYIKSIFDDAKNNSSYIDVRFSKDNFTYWNGYSVVTGNLVSKGEYLNDKMTDDDAIKIFEKNITTGYERHGLINPHILNLEFLFEDEYADYYDMHRYIGFYVDTVEVSSMELDLDRLYDFQDNLDNTPVIKIRPRIANEERVMENSKGVKLPFVGDVCDIEPDDFVVSEENLVVPYITGKDKKFYTLNPDEPFTVSRVDDYVYSIFNVRASQMDVGNMYGTDRILLQQNATELTDQGRSYVWIDFLGDLVDYDELLIYHINGTRYDDVLNMNYDKVEIFNGFTETAAAGEYYAYEDYVGSPEGSDTFDMYYMNGESLHNKMNVTAEAFVALLSSFDKMPFDMYVDGARVYMVNKVESDQDDKFFVRFNTTYGNYTNISINGSTGDDLVGTYINAEGGTDNAYRVRIDVKYYDYIKSNIGDVLAKTNKTWEYLDKVSYYVDDIENGFSDIFSYVVLCIDKTYTDGLDLTNNSVLLMHEFASTLGLFAFYPLKDFDFDYNGSSYNRMPTWELYKYFYIPAGKNLIQPDVWYRVAGTGTIMYNGVQYTDKNTGNEVNDVFLGVAGVQSYTVRNGNPFVIYSGVDSSYIDQTDVPLYDGNDDIIRFNGYFAIRDAFYTKEVIPVDNEYRDVFFDNMLSSEYHYYRENFVPELSMDSRLVPYVVKWGYVDGNNARDVRYRLNNHMVFGVNNFSPDPFETAQNPLNMTHEWPYLISSHEFINDDAVNASNYCYFPDPLTIDEAGSMFVDSTIFDSYFNYAYVNDGGTQKAGTQQRYSYVKYNSVFGRYETFFRGAKIIFNERDITNSTKLPNGKPAVVANSDRFDGYRFTAILYPRQEDIIGDHAPITYKFIESKENKFIIFVIEVYLGSVDNVTTSLEGLNSDPNSEYYYRSVLADGTSVPMVEGDYRVNFNGDGVSDITYLYLYSVQNKKFNNLINSFSTIKLSDIYRFDSMTFVRDNAFVIDAENNPAFPNYDFRVSDEVQNFDGAAVFIMDYVARENAYFNVVDLVGSPSVIVNDNPVYQAIDRALRVKRKLTSYEFYLTYDTDTLYATVPTNSIPTNFRQLMGGKNYYKNIFSKLSFAQIREYINGMGPNKSNPIIEYLTWEGASTDFATDQFYVEIVQPEKIVKSSAIVPMYNEDLRAEFKSDAQVSFELYKQNVKQGYPLMRYSGEYEPIFKDVVYFYRDAIYPYNSYDLFLSNTKFAVDVEGFGVLKNFTHLKISDKSVLKYESDNKLYPKYELIDEITIGFADYFYFVSNWDMGYHKKYVTKSSYVDVYGSLRIAEDYSFVSKLIKLRDEVEITDFDVSVYSGRGSVDNLDFSKYEIVVQDVGNTIVGYINIRNALIRYLYDDGIHDKFNEYLLSDVVSIGNYTMEDYVNAYVDFNIVGLYAVDNVTFLGAELNSDVTASTLFSEAISLDSNEFKGAEINKVDEYLYKFTYNKRDGDNTQVLFKTKIKLI